jgi:hypothetical protein
MNTVTDELVPVGDAQDYIRAVALAVSERVVENALGRLDPQGRDDVILDATGDVLRGGLAEVRRLIANQAAGQDERIAALEVSNAALSAEVSALSAEVAAQRQAAAERPAVAKITHDDGTVSRVEFGG